MDNNELLKAIGEVIDGKIEALTNTVNEIRETVGGLTETISNIQAELKEFRKETNERFDTIEDKINNLEGTNASNHIDMNGKIDKISDDLDYLTHKEAQTEKDVFTIKKKLNIIK